VVKPEFRGNPFWPQVTVLLISPPLHGELSLKHDILYQEIPSITKTIRLLKSDPKWSVNLWSARVLTAWKEWTKKPHLSGCPFWSGAVEGWGKEKRV